MAEVASSNMESRCVRRRVVLAAGYVAVLALPVAAHAAPPCPPQALSVDGGTVISASKDCPVLISTQSDTPDYVDPVQGITLLAGRTITNVANSSALTSALSSAACGTDIKLASGTFAGNFTAQKTCPANNPIRIVGQAQFASTVTGTFTLRGAQNILAGVLFSGSDAKVVCQGTNNKVLANKFTGWRGAAIRPDNEAAPGKECEVAYNEIYSPGEWIAGATTLTGNARRGITMNSGGNGRGSTAHLRAWVHHNYLHDFPNKPDPANFDSGDSDAMEIGESGYDWTPILSTGWYIEDNLIENHLQAGQAAVDVKVGGVVFRRNTLKRSPNTRFDMRFGSNQIFESNWNESGGGTWHGENNSAFCNYFAGEVKLKSGSSAPLEGTNGHAGTYNLYLAKNRFGNLVVGHFTNTTEKAYPSTLTMIEEHTGPIVLSNHVDTSNNAKAVSTRRCSPPVALDASEVGPGALSRASAEYRAARVP